MSNTRTTTWLVVIPAVCIVLAAVGITHASQANIPNTFVGGTPALAAEVNANFAALKAAIDDNDSRLGSLETALGGLVADQLVRVSHSEETTAVNDFDESVFTSIHSNTVTAPTDGILVVMATVNAEWDNSNAVEANFDLALRLSVDGNAISSSYQHEIYDPGAGTAPQIMNLIAAAEVSAGNLLVSVDALTPSSWKAFILERSITTIFVPFGDSGIQGLLD